MTRDGGSAGRLDLAMIAGHPWIAFLKTPPRPVLPQRAQLPWCCLAWMQRIDAHVGCWCRRWRISQLSRPGRPRAGPVPFVPIPHKAAGGTRGPGEAPVSGLRGGRFSGCPRARRVAPPRHRGACWTLLAMASLMPTEPQSAGASVPGVSWPPGPRSELGRSAESDEPPPPALPTFGALGSVRAQVSSCVTAALPSASPRRSRRR